MKLKILLGTLFLTHLTVPAQDTKTEMAIYNVGLGGVVGGIGSVINKSKGDKTGAVFLKGFMKGALGGYLVYESKNIISRIEKEQKLEYSWAAKMVNSAGTSIIEGASLNDRFLSSWHMNIGFNRLELKTDGNMKLRYKIMPVSFFLTAYVAMGNRFDVESSLRTGEFIFSSSEVTYNQKRSGGVNYGNVFVYDRSLSETKATIAHEIIHTYQYYDFNFVNAYLDKPLKKLDESSSFFNGLRRYLYFDLQGPVVRGLYALEGGTNNEYYYDNFFENEAAFWSNTYR